MKTIKISSIILLSFIAFSSCKKKGCMEDLANNYEAKAKTDDGSCTYDDTTLEIEFNHSVGSESLVFNNVQYTSASGNTYSVEKLVYLISDIVVYNQNGDSVVVDNEHYVDAEDISTLIFTTSQSLPLGTYTSVKFTFGLNADKNNSGRFPNAPESNMEWPEMIGGGYHFMKLEGKYDSLATGNIKNYATHTGSQTMMGNTNLNHFEVVIAQEFIVEGHDKASIQLNMDINNWYDSPIYDFNDYDAGIMMSMPTQNIVQENGANVFSITNVIITE
jgi:hypothetical protein